MKKILEITYSKINHVEKILRDSDFYNKYKIGVISKYKQIYAVTLGKKYKEGGDYKIQPLSSMNCRLTLDSNEVFGHYDDKCSRNHKDKYCVLSETKDSYIMTINHEHICGPYVDGYERHEYGNGQVPMGEFAYGSIANRYMIFSISKSLNDIEILAELNKVLARNDYYFSPEFREKRYEDMMKKKLKEKILLIEEDLKKIDREKAKKMELYVKLKKDLEIGNFKMEKKEVKLTSELFTVLDAKNKKYFKKALK